MIFSAAIEDQLNKLIAHFVRFAFLRFFCALLLMDVVILVSQTSISLGFGNSSLNFAVFATW